MKTILLKFSGPLQSWGTKSHFETRQTDNYPSKSAVIGMISAALGYRRTQDEKLKVLNKLSFAVRIDQPGKILRDFQIATSHKSNGKKDRSYVTNRYYLQDAVFMVAIGSDNIDLMKKIKLGLEKPYFQLYLGRRSLPINADYFFNILDKDVIQSLKSIDWQASNWYQRQWYHHNKSNGLTICADADLVNSAYGFMARDIPISFSQGETQSKDNHFDRRNYQLREIRYLRNITVPEQEED